MDFEISKLPGRKIPLLVDVIESLMRVFGKGVIRSTLLFVYFSQGGIFEHELLHLVSQEVERMKRAEATVSRHEKGRTSHDVGKLEGFSFSLLYQRLKPLLPTTASGLLQFFHNDMRTLIFNLFLGGEGNDLSQITEENQQKQFELQTDEERRASLRYNCILAEYYLKQVEDEGNYDMRAIQSLSIHMMRANMMDELHKFLLLPRVFMVMFSSDLRVEFLSLWANCLSSLDSAAADVTQLPLSDPQSQGEGDHARITKIFCDLDLNGDGAISCREFRPFALRMGYVQDAVDEEFNSIDIDCDGEISMTEFLSFFQNKRLSMDTSEFEALLKQVDQGRVELVSDRKGGLKNLSQWYRESLASDHNDIDDPVEEAQVFCLLGEFFQLTREEAQGLALDSDESESFYKQALVLNPKATAALIGLSRLERDRKELGSAMAYLRDAMGYLQSSYGYKHIEVARCQRNMAEVCLMQNDFQTAKQVIVKARKIVTETCGKQSLEYCDFMMSEGDVLASIANKTKISPTNLFSFRWNPALRKKSKERNPLKQKLFKDSIAAYREAIAQQKLVMGEKHPAVLMSYDRLIANVMEQPDLLTEEQVVEFAKPRLATELSISDTLQQSKSVFEWLEMIVQVHAAQQQQENDSSEVGHTDIPLQWEATKRGVAFSRVPSSQWYHHADSKLQEPRAVSQPIEMTEAIKDSATLIKPAYDQGLALQVCAQTDALELAEMDGSDNQLWLWHGEEVQHVATGLFLDAEVKYMYTAELG